MNKKTERRLINIKDIEVDPEMYPRTAYNIIVVEEYAEAMKRGEKFPPIVVNQQYTGVGKKYQLIDGRHRMEAAEMNGETHIEAEVYKDLDEKEIYIMAVELNSKHGVKISRTDKIEKIIPKLKEFEVEVAKISELTNMPLSEIDIKRMVVRKAESEQEFHPITSPQRVDYGKSYKNIKKIKTHDIEFVKSKGGILIKAKPNALAVLEEFVNRKFGLHIENGRIIFEKCD